MEILFIRHGETEANLKNQYYGFTDSPMTQKGRKQAETAGVILKLRHYRPDKIYVSERLRTHETLELMGFSMKDARVDGRINEQNLGMLECMTYPEISEKYPEVFDDWNEDYHGYRVPGGESHRDLYRRVSEFLDEIVDRFKDTDNKILVVSHGGVMASVYTYIIGGILDRRDSAHFTNCSILSTRHMDNGLVIRSLSDPVEIFELAKEFCNGKR